MVNAELTAFVSQLSIIAGPVIDTFGPGLLVASPVGAVLLWIANNWRRRCVFEAANAAKIERAHHEAIDLANGIFQGHEWEIATERQVIAGKCDQLNRNITEARKDTRRSSARRIVRIAEGVE